MIKFKHEYGPQLLCSVDPITLTGLALAGAATAGVSALAGGSSTPAPATMAAPASPAPPVQSPVGTAQPQRSNTPSFVGASSVPQQSGYGQKTLLGQ